MIRLHRPRRPLRDWDFEFADAPAAWARLIFHSADEPKLRAHLEAATSARHVEDKDDTTTEPEDVAGAPFPDGGVRLHEGELRFRARGGGPHLEAAVFRTLLASLLADRSLRWFGWEIGGDGGIRLRSGTAGETLIEYLQEAACSFCRAEASPELFGEERENSPRICAACVPVCLNVLVDPEQQIARFTACAFCRTDFGNGIQARRHLYMGLTVSICRPCLEAAESLR